MKRQTNGYADMFQNREVFKVCTVPTDGFWFLDRVDLFPMRLASMGVLPPPDSLQSRPASLIQVEYPHERFTLRGADQPSSLQYRCHPRPPPGGGEEEAL
jgi:hypothetical protein